MRRGRDGRPDVSGVLVDTLHAALARREGEPRAAALARLQAVKKKVGPLSNVRSSKAGEASALCQRLDARLHELQTVEGLLIKITDPTPHPTSSESSGSSSGGVATHAFGTRVRGVVKLAILLQTKLGRRRSQEEAEDPSRRDLQAVVDRLEGVCRALDDAPAAGGVDVLLRLGAEDLLVWCGSGGCGGTPVRMVQQRKSGSGASGGGGLPVAFPALAVDGMWTAEDSARVTAVFLAQIHRELLAAAAAAARHAVQAALRRPDGGAQEASQFLDAVASAVRALDTELVPPTPALPGVAAPAKKRAASGKKGGKKPSEDKNKDKDKDNKDKVASSSGEAPADPPIPPPAAVAVFAGPSEKRVSQYKAGLQGLLAAVEGELRDAVVAGTARRVKLRYAGDVRVTTVSEALPFDIVAAQFRTFLELGSAAPLAVRYDDREGDVVLIKTTAEYREAWAQYHRAVAAAPPPSKKDDAKTMTFLIDAGAGPAKAGGKAAAAAPRKGSQKGTAAGVRRPSTPPAGARASASGGLGVPATPCPNGSGAESEKANRAKKEKEVDNAPLPTKREDPAVPARRSGAGDDLARAAPSDPPAPAKGRSSGTGQAVRRSGEWERRGAPTQKATPPGPSLPSSGTSAHPPAGGRSGGTGPSPAVRRGAPPSPPEPQQVPAPTGPSVANPGTQGLLAAMGRVGKPPQQQQPAAARREEHAKVHPQEMARQGYISGDEGEDDDEPAQHGIPAELLRENRPATDPSVGAVGAGRWDVPMSLSLRTVASEATVMPHSRPASSGQPAPQKPRPGERRTSGNSNASAGSGNPRNVRHTGMGAGGTGPAYKRPAPGALPGRAPSGSKSVPTDAHGNLVMRGTSLDL
eukprot:TRINITY_DN19138_c0_g1_i1.p1 TRINITY_DN19138_c0_g1~~TRINITY_DN19138_c0_g1_i1.p1  ORF type:complete len:864 (+),score=226.41 TRINITY_DN19138_c0_g1_i1:54-2645(+)